MKYLTKSRFILALECLTKLYYTKKSGYADNSLDDPFLLELAKGGFQVGELAKYLFSGDPASEKISVEAAGYEDSLKQTGERLRSSPDIVLAEASFSSDSLFARVDLLQKKGSIINIYEVKSKSVDGDNEKFLTKKEDKVIAEWISYLYDIAFQKYVVSKSAIGRECTVIPFLILVDKTKQCDVDGMNSQFKVIRKGKNSKEVLTNPGLKKSDLDLSILKIVNVSEHVEKILTNYPVPTDLNGNISFEDFVKLAAEKYAVDEKIPTPLGAKCKKCEFNNNRTDLENLKSGFYECWKEKTGYADTLLEKNLVTELWGGYTGRRSLVNELLSQGIYLLSNISETDIIPEKQNPGNNGLTPHQRRMEQINRVKKGIPESYFDKDGFEKASAEWVWPLHMIDFETTAPALPFSKGRRPYEGIAFQFSHHIIEKNGSIRHEGEYISFEAGGFPNYKFVRELKKQLETDNGSVFRYHNHENTYLNFIHGQLENDPEPPGDKAELQEFIRQITTWGPDNARQDGPRTMIDLYRIVIKYYYPPFARGSNSIKKILPAIINDSEYLRNKYSRPVYGKDLEITSLNFENKIWIDPGFNYDPYKTLPKLFNDYDRETLDVFLSDLEEVADGGAAMAAYGYLQYSEVSPEMREEIKAALLRYCELDTMAMVMIIEGLMNK